MDCVRTAVRQNAKSVKCLYRRDRENMPGSAREVYNAEEEGVEFIWLSNPKKFIGTSQISSVLVERMKLGKRIRLEEKNLNLSQILNLK